MYVDVIINHDVAEWYRPVRQEDTTKRRRYYGRVVGRTEDTITVETITKKEAIDRMDHPSYYAAK